MQQISRGIDVVWSDGKKRRAPTQKGAFLEAARIGDQRTLKYLIEHGSESKTNLVTEKDENGQTALTIAVKNNQPVVIKYILDATNYQLKLAHLTEKFDGLNLLMFAVTLKSAYMIEKLLAVEKELQLAQLTAKDPSGQIALVIAVNSRHAHLITALLRVEKDVQLAQLTDKNSDGWNALAIAVAHGRQDAINALLEVDEDVQLAQLSARTNDMRNVVMIAAQYYSINEIRMLFAAADKNSNQLKEMKELKHTQLTETDENGNNALVIAKVNGNEGVVEFLVPYYVDSMLLIPMFVSSFVEKDAAGRETQYGTNLRIMPIFNSLFDYFVRQLNDGNVTAREMAVSYLGGLVQQTAEAALSVDDVYATFMKILNGAITKQSDKVNPSKVMREAIELFTEKYYGNEYMNVYGDDMLSLSILLIEMKNQDKEQQTKEAFIAEKLSDPLTVAKIDRFLARHEPDDSPRVLDIERRIAALRSK